MSSTNSEVIELTYNPKQIAFEKQQRQKKLEQRAELEEEEDYVEPPSEPEGETEHEEEVFRSFKLDISTINKEFMCPPFPAQTRPLHFLSVPMICTCCGQSACYECLKNHLAMGKNECPFCQ